MYRWNDPSGKVIYSDKAPPEGTKDVRKIVTDTAPPPPPPAPKATEKTGKGAPASTSAIAKAKGLDTKLSQEECVKQRVHQRTLNAQMIAIVSRPDSIPRTPADKKRLEDLAEESEAINRACSG